jgi:hypothetical protein
VPSKLTLEFALSRQLLVCTKTAGFPALAVLFGVMSVLPPPRARATRGEVDMELTAYATDELY